MTCNGNTEQTTAKDEKQIPFGDDNQRDKNKSKDNGNRG
jgi:hypothetical protein